MRVFRDSTLVSCLVLAVGVVACELCGLRGLWRGVLLPLCCCWNLNGALSRSVHCCGERDRAREFREQSQRVQSQRARVRVGRGAGRQRPPPQRDIQQHERATALTTQHTQQSFHRLCI